MSNEFYKVSVPEVVKSLSATKTGILDALKDEKIGKKDKRKMMKHLRKIDNGLLAYMRLVTDEELKERIENLFPALKSQKEE